MKIAVHAVGRMKTGPEKELADRYFGRFAKAGPAVGLDFGGVVEPSESRARGVDERRQEEGGKLESLIAAGGIVVLLDERGPAISSQNFADRLAAFRDAGHKSLTIAIGGPDGHSETLRMSSAAAISFGAATWPHQLVRIMLAEQLYRAVTILSGHPYHRE